jgi:hypothetical protein
MGQVRRDYHRPPPTGGRKMKAVAEIVAAIILLVSGSNIAPNLIKEFKVEIIKKLDQGLPPLHGFTKKLIRNK